MARMTTREKFRARRNARKEAAYWSGVKWSYSDLCILRKSDAKPLVFNTCPTDAFRESALLWEFISNH